MKSIYEGSMHFPINFSRDEGSVFDGGEVAFLEKSREHKLRMECVGSDGEDELRLSSRTSTTNKRFKFPKKFIKDGCSTGSGCHIHVPRKLRSAMKKRSRESVSPPLPVCKKLNHVAYGVELLTKDGSVKSKLKMKQSEAQGCVTGGTQGPVTKDEEEVVEALYALAGVFSNAVKTDKARSAGQELGANSSNLTKAEGFLTPFDAFGSEKRHTIQKVTFDSVVSGDWTELSKTRSKLPNLEKSLASVKYPTTVLAPIAAASRQTEVQHTIKETRNNGSSSRTDLSSAISCDTQELEIPLQTHIANLPVWFESTSCSAQSPKFESSVIAKKDAQVAIDSKNSWKRCTAHVYISRFIKVFQITERKNRCMIISTELATNDAPQQVAHTTAVDLTGGRNGRIGVVCSDSFSSYAPEKNATEVRNAILLHKSLIQDEQQASAPYEVYTAQNQSLDFLSLPAGRGQLETSNRISRAGNGLGISAQLRFPGLLSRNQPPIPFPVPQNCYSSASFSGHPSVAAVQKVQVPPYVGSTSYGPTLMDATASSVQKPEQQQQKPAPLLMAHYKSGVASPIIPNKQTEGPDLPLVFQHVQTLFPPSLSSLEVLGARYAPALQQQQHHHHQYQHQQLMSATSVLPSPTVKGQYHHLPSVYEANVGGVRSDNVPLRIICNQFI